MCCGTGLNFNLLEEAVGPEGKIIGVDLTDSMLKQAQRLIDEKQWKNVELIQSDAASFRFPDGGVDGILSTFAITLVPEFDQVICSGADVLRPGKRWVVLDFKLPDNWLRMFVPLALLITRPFAVTKKLADRRPWNSIAKYLTNVQMTELYGGFAYTAAGERPIL